MIRFRRATSNGGKRTDSGYMLLVLMLAVAVLMITMMGVARNYRRSVQRDREVEMIHRGEQYARAVQRFYRVNKRYPVSIEQLENMNKIRYLRKRYKDPMSPDGAWKIVHPMDVKLKSSATQSTGIGSATGTTGAATAAGGTASASQAGTPDGANTTADNTGTSTDTGSTTGTTTGTDTGSTGSAFGSSGASGTGNNAANGQVLGGGDVYGVVSKSKKEGTHIFGEKSKYNEWFFIYDPGQDQNNGRLIVGPYNPKMFVGTVNAGINNGSGSGNMNGNTGGSPGTTNSGSGTTNSGGGASSPGTSSPSPTTTP
jgi:type II secretory pathway pseudopilin PulG